MIVHTSKHYFLEYFIYYLLLKLLLFIDVTNTPKLQELTNDLRFFSIENFNWTCSATRVIPTVSCAVERMNKFCIQHF